MVGCSIRPGYAEGLADDDGVTPQHVQELGDARPIEGARPALEEDAGSRRFLHVTFPLLANLYLICTLLSTLWTLGDFVTVYLVSGGGPGLDSGVLATLRLSLRVRRRQSGTRRCGGDVGPSGADSDHDRADAQAPDERGAAMSIALSRPMRLARRRYRLRRVLTEAGSVMLGTVLLIWSWLPSTICS